MANWVRDYLAEHHGGKMPVGTVLCQRSIHVPLGNGEWQAGFTSNPIAYQDKKGQWKPIDTALVASSKGWSAPGTPVTISKDGTVSIEGYSQRTIRIGQFRPSSGEMTVLVNISLGKITDDTAVAMGDNWERRITVRDKGITETLTLKSKPKLEDAKDDDCIALETLVMGLTLPDGELGAFKAGDSVFRIPRAWDAKGKEIKCIRQVVNRKKQCFVYTGIPIEVLETADYPITIDPDITGDAVDGIVWGEDTDYATTRSTGVFVLTGQESGLVGQSKAGGDYIVERLFLRFDTSSIPNIATIVQVNLKMVCLFDGSTTDFDVQIVKQNWSGQDPLNAGNCDAAYDGCLSGPADNNIWRNTAGIVLYTQYTSGNLDTTWPDRSGYTYYSLRSSRDYSGIPSKAPEDILLGLAENTNPAYRPVLIIKYTRPVTVTAINACNAALYLQNTEGSLVDISGSSNQVEVAITQKMSEIPLARSAFPKRVVVSADATINLAVLYTTSQAEGMQILKDWYFNHRKDSRYIRIQLPDANPGSDQYQYECVLNDMSIPAEASSADPMKVTANLSITGQPTWAVVAS